MLGGRNEKMNRGADPWGEWVETAKIQASWGLANARGWQGLVRSHLFPMTLSPSLVTNVSTDAFPDVVVRAALPVLVAFWTPRAETCDPIAALLEELSVEYADRLLIAKVNADNENGLMVAFGILSVPTLLFYRDGAPIEMISAPKNAADLTRWINRHLAAPFLANQNS